MKVNDLKAFCDKAKKLKPGTITILNDYACLCSGVLTTHNSHYEVSQHFEALDFGSDNLLIPIKELCKVVEKLKGGDIEFLFDGRTVIFKTSKGEFKFEIGKDLKPDEFPVFDNTAFTDVYELKAGDVELLIKASNYCASDELRPIQGGICLSGGEITAADSNKLCFYKSEIGARSEVLIPKDLVKLIDKKGYRAVNFDKIFRLEDSEGLSVSCRKIEGKYPNYRAVIPTDNPISVEVDSAELIEGLESCEIAINKGSNLAVFDMVEGAFMLSCKNTDEGKSFKTLIKGEVEGGDLTIGFNQKMLLTILKTEKTKSTIFEFSSKERAFLINKNVLLMPCFVG